MRSSPSIERRWAVRLVFCCGFPFLLPPLFAETGLEQAVKDSARYGNTPEHRTLKTKALAKLSASGPDGLRAVMAKAHIRNVSLSVLLDHAVTQTPGEVVAPVLAEFLDDPHWRTRKVAAYYLGYYDAPRYPEAVAALLDDEEAAGAAVRTLGKWKEVAYREQVEAFLQHPKERWRVLAANALRDMGDPRAAPALVAALGDDFFTVRETAERALRSLGPSVRPEVEAALEHAGVRKRRHLSRILDTLSSNEPL